MPSRNQPAGKSTDWEDIFDDHDRADDTFREAVKMLHTKNDATIKGIIRGIRKPARARAYIEAEVAISEYDDRDIRRPLVGMLNTKQDDLKAEDEDD